jgi:cytochrome c2
MKRTVFVLFLFFFCTNLSVLAKNGKNSKILYQPIDSLSIAKGQELFTQNCTSCHQIKVDAIGPRLSGITSVTSPAWVKKFIKNSQAFIAAGDERATQVFLKYKKAVMPSYNHLPETEIEAIVDYLTTTKCYLLQWDARYKYTRRQKSKAHGRIVPLHQQLVSFNITRALSNSRLPHQTHQQRTTVGHGSI